MGRKTQDMIHTIMDGEQYETSTCRDSTGKVWLHYLSARYSIVTDATGRSSMVLDKVCQNIFRNITIAYKCITGAPPTTTPPVQVAPISAAAAADERA